MLPPALLALSPGDLEPGDVRAFRLRVERAVAAGLAGVLLREPALGDAVFVGLARDLRDALDRRAGGRGWLGIHDRVHLAAAVGADAVHLGFRSLPPAVVRERFAPRWGGRRSIGLSTHAGDDTSVWRAADYLFHGPVRDTPSKRGRVAPVGFDGLARAAAATAVPVWGLGGLEPADAAAVRAAGARGMAVLRGVLARPDAERRVGPYLDAWRAAAVEGA